MAVSDLRYIGMGGFKFFDFRMVHRYIGIREMISLEHDPAMALRARYNRPYSFIKVFNESSTSFLLSDKFKGSSIYWLDYDSAISDVVIDDIQILATRMNSNSFLFVTVASEIPGDLRKFNSAERLERVQEQFGAYAGGLTRSDVEDSGFPATAHKILRTAIKNAFAARADDPIYIRFEVAYRDTTSMITVGGHVCGAEMARRMDDNLMKNVPFLLGASPFTIRNFNLSERERHLFETAATASIRTMESDQLLRLGFKTSDITDYKNLIRFEPRYHESVL